MELDRVERFLYVFDKYPDENTDDHAKENERGKETIKETESTEKRFGILLSVLRAKGTMAGQTSLL